MNSVSTPSIACVARHTGPRLALLQGTHANHFVWEKSVKPCRQSARLSQELSSFSSLLVSDATHATFYSAEVAAKQCCLTSSILTVATMQLLLKLPSIVLLLSQCLSILLSPKHNPSRFFLLLPFHPNPPGRSPGARQRSTVFMYFVFPRAEVKIRAAAFSGALTHQQPLVRGSTFL